MKRTMTPDFNPTLFRGDLMNGKLRAAMDYLSQFPAQSERYARYAARFQEGRCEAPTGDPKCSAILLAYQAYYRDAFYLEQSPEDAAQRLTARLAEALDVDPKAGISGLEDLAAEAFQSKGFHFLGGRTSGYYGPYIWR